MAVSEENIFYLTVRIWAKEAGFSLVVTMTGTKSRVIWYQFGTKIIDFLN